MHSRSMHFTACKIYFNKLLKTRRGPQRCNNQKGTEGGRAREENGKESRKEGSREEGKVGGREQRKRSTFYVYFGELRQQWPPKLPKIRCGATKSSLGAGENSQHSLGKRLSQASSSQYAVRAEGRFGEPWRPPHWGGGLVSL